MSSRDSKYIDVHTTLKAIGKAVFVKFYYQFKDISLSENELADIIYQNNPLSVSSNQRLRIPRARHIFREKQNLEALKIIVDSKKLSAELREMAARILLEEKKMEISILDSAEERTFISELNHEFPFSKQVPFFQYIHQPKAAHEKVFSNTQRYVRSKSTAQNALRLAQYKCEVDLSHSLFKRRSSDFFYTEPHHLVPLAASGDFPGICLDREQNIISLCNTCHNHLHYGAEPESILEPLFKKRKEMLKLIGIELSFEQLLQYYQ